MKYPKKNIKSYICSIIYIPVFALSLVFFDIIARIVNLLSKKSLPSLMNILNSWMLCIMKINGTKIEILDKKNINHKVPVLFISNHQSLMDIPLIYCLYPELDTKFIAKKELSRFLPFVSYMLRNGGHAIIDRNNRSQAMEEIKNLCARVEENNNGIMIFPEGTRARDGKIKDFKLGGIKQVLSFFSEIQIIPIAIDGSWRYSYYKLMPVPFGEKITVKVGNISNKLDNLKDIETEIGQLLEEIRHEKKS